MAADQQDGPGTLRALAWNGHRRRDSFLQLPNYMDQNRLEDTGK